MKKETLFAINTIYRQPIPVHGLIFGSGEKSLAIVGSLRGNEVQQLYICSQIVKLLSRYEADGLIAPGKQIMVIPCVNAFSMNVGKRFWAADNTDINRMFPGYSKGETTQRIAASLFEHLKGHVFGIQLSSFYIPGNFVPHVRILDTGFHDLDLCDFFGLPYVMVSKPMPVDTGTLNYNWQVFDTKAFSIYSKETKNVHIDSAIQAIEATFQFMQSQGIIRSASPTEEGSYYPFHPVRFKEEDLVNVLSQRGGIFLHRSQVGDEVKTGALLAETLDPYGGNVIERMVAPCDGRIFFNHNSNLIGGHEVSCRIIPDNRASIA
ncbi:MAG: succinylglutamate desuccinylase/aspartoacylase family protein [Clostridiales bacterium]|jgi:predicted deacylase|nr:succinylglutamate desuccinylase/aspartoacylase family protein [Clostridiales bacterium]